MNVVEKTIRRIDAAQQRHAVSAFAFGIVKKYGDDNAGTLTVQLTYSMIVTVFPLLLLLVTVLGIVLADDPSARHRVLDSAFGQFPIVGSSLSHNLHALKRSSVFGIVVGLLGLVYGSTSLAQSGLFTMEQTWNIPGAVRPNYLTRMVRSLIFLVVLAFGLILTTALTGFGTFGRHDFWLGVIGEVIGAAVNIGLYLIAFRTLTPKQVATRSLIPGAIAGGVAWTILQAVGGYLVGHDLKNASALYGAFGLFLGLIAWIYLGAQITVYSTEVNTVLHRRLWPRGMVQPPLTLADQKSMALQATENQRRPEQIVATRFTSRPMRQEEYLENGFQVDQSTPGIEVQEPPTAIAGEDGSKEAI